MLGKRSRASHFTETCLTPSKYIQANWTESSAAQSDNRNSLSKYIRASPGRNLELHVWKIFRCFCKKRDYNSEKDQGLARQGLQRQVLTAQPEHPEYRSLSWTKINSSHVSCGKPSLPVNIIINLPDYCDPVGSRQGRARMNSGLAPRANQL